MATTITPAVGQGVVWTAQGAGTTPGYSAIDDRRAALEGAQEGVLPGDTMQGTAWECVERTAGANNQVQITANVACAKVQGDSVTAQGLYTVAPHSAVILETITAAHATLPRIDQVILEVLDNVHDASGSSLARVRVLAGTPTASADLNNRLGAAALPGSAIRLDDMLIDANGAGTVTLTNAKIRDRRPWARGALARGVRSSGDVTFTSGSYTVIDSTNLKLRVECSGVPVRVRLPYVYEHSVTDNYVVMQLNIDGVAHVSADGAYTQMQPKVINTPHHAIMDITLVPAAGSHTFEPLVSTQAATAKIRAGSAGGTGLVLTVEELPRQNYKNNTTTTG